MGLLDNVSNSVAEIGDLIRNPFSRNPQTSLTGDDFPKGFEIEELEGPKQKLALKAHLMPEIPFVFGGSMRNVKEFYPGNPEPVVHILGGNEADITIKGRLWDKKFSNDFGGSATSDGIADAIREVIEGIRRRGNLVKIKMGEFQRYCYLTNTEFSMKNLRDIRYNITFLIVGFTPPLKSQFVGESINIPKDINQELGDALAAYEAKQVPSGIPTSIADILNSAISDVAGVVSAVTGLVDDVLTTVESIEGSVFRAIGIINNAKNTIYTSMRRIGSISTSAIIAGRSATNAGTFLSGQVTSRYTDFSFISAQNTSMVDFLSLLERMRLQFAAIAKTVPLARHLVREGDTLHSLAYKFYDDDGQWKRIYIHNKLSSTDLTSGAVLEIPRL